MPLPAHRVPPHLFDALAAGGGGGGRGRRPGRSPVQQARAAVGARPRPGTTCHHDQWPFADRGYEFLADAQDRDPAAANRVISHSSVGAWAIRTLRALGGGSAHSGAEPGGLCAVAASAAIQARLPGQIGVPVVTGRSCSPALGAATADGSRALVPSSGAWAAEVVSQSHRVAVPADPHQNGPGWAGLRRVQAGPLDALVDDLDPFRMPAARTLLRVSAQTRPERGRPRCRRLGPCSTSTIRPSLPRSRPQSRSSSRCRRRRRALTARHARNVRRDRDVTAVRTSPAGHDADSRGPAHEAVGPARCRTAHSA